MPNSNVPVAVPVAAISEHLATFILTSITDEEFADFMIRRVIFVYAMNIGLSNAAFVKAMFSLAKPCRSRSISSKHGKAACI